MFRCSVGACKLAQPLAAVTVSELTCRIRGTVVASYRLTLELSVRADEDVTSVP